MLRFAVNPAFWRHRAAPVGEAAASEAPDVPEGWLEPPPAAAAGGREHERERDDDAAPGGPPLAPRRHGGDEAIDPVPQAGPDRGLG
jgi:hypothetical protein